MSGVIGLTLNRRMRRTGGGREARRGARGVGALACARGGVVRGVRIGVKRGRGRGAGRAAAGGRTGARSVCVWVCVGGEEAALSGAHTLPSAFGLGRGGRVLAGAALANKTKPPPSLNGHPHARARR